LNYIYEQLAGLEAVSPFSYVLVLLGGILSAVSICYVPILVMFSGYMGKHAEGGTGKALRITAGFTVGMIMTSAMIGIVAAFVGKSIMVLFTGYSLDVWIPAVVGILMGLQLLGVLKLKMPGQLQVKAQEPKTTFGAFTLGLPFGLVITPCTIPIFIMIITHVVFTGSMVHGALLLATYAIGKGIILAVVATSSSAFLKDLTKKWGSRVEVIAGIILLLASLYLIFFQVQMPVPQM
jgi:cytochrome c-type biogenesis protein